jgi:putative transposase
MPDQWTELVNRVETEGELTALRRSVVRGAPYGELAWQAKVAVALGLESSLRDPGRPKRANVAQK